MEPHISICIPTYNASKLLKNNLDRIFSLKHENIEVVVGDDGSTDNTSTLLKEYNDDRLEWYSNKENMQFDANILKAVDKCNGEYILFLSDEDRLINHGLSTMLDIIEDYGVFSVIFGNVLDLRGEGTGNYYQKESTYWEHPTQSLSTITNEIPSSIGWLPHSYMSGVLVKRSEIDTPFLTKFIGCVYMVSFIIVTALMNSEIYWIDEPVCAIGPNQAGREIRSSETTETPVGINTVSGRVTDQKYRLQLAEDLDISEKSRDQIIKRERLSITDTIINLTRGNIFQSYRWLEKCSLDLSKSDIISLLIQRYPRFIVKRIIS
jgi:Glycosyltransferases involved in cell wall biogenesis